MYVHLVTCPFIRESFCRRFEPRTAAMTIKDCHFIVRHLGVQLLQSSHSDFG
jgi:hypothetical protein